ncbi:MAG: KilA-N domain-containing protein [Candidatus Symbiothrix sp.]|jgi:hypothetical protein|nr:KilA-N domain-containing protein [Candidatus Symbiothrix sp.]
MNKKGIINVQGTDVTVISSGHEDYICITDMANAKEGQGKAYDIIKNWIRTRSTLEFLGVWEEMYNPNFKAVEFDRFKMQAGLHNFVLTPGQWIEKTNAIGMYVERGKYGGTYAHKDIAFEFGSAIETFGKRYFAHTAYYNLISSNSTYSPSSESMIFSLTSGCGVALLWCAV